jgi:hypothetical protein
MTDGAGPDQPAAGSFKSGRFHWNYAESDGMFDVWTHDEVTAADLGAAIRRLSTLRNFLELRMQTTGYRTKRNACWEAH